MVEYQTDMPFLEPNPVLDEKWLKRATWWEKHGRQLKIAVFGLVVAVEAGLIFFSSYGWLDALWLSRRADAQLIKDLTVWSDVTELHTALAPKPLNIAAAVVLPGSASAGSFDALAKIENPNSEWAATIVYTFVHEGGETAPAATFVLNDDQRFVIGSGVAKSTTLPPVLRLTDIKWQRLIDPEEAAALKPNFLVSDVTLEAPRRLGAGSVSQVGFTVTNESIYSFWSVGFTVILLQRDNPVAARFVTLDQVRSRKQRDVSLNIFSSLPTVTEVLVVPEVNILDASVFMPIESGTTTF